MFKKKYWKQIRAMLYAWKKFGHDDAQKQFWEKFDKKHRSEWTQGPSFGKVVKGKIEYMGMVRGRSDPRYLRFRNQLKMLAPGLVHDPADQRPQLLWAFLELERMEDVHRRGFLFQDFLRRLFTYYEIKLERPFTRNEGAEQIDGTFSLNGWFYLVEARWRKAPANIRELDGLYGQLSRSGRQTVGMFISVNGWSENAANVLLQNPEKGIILMNGSDIRNCLESGDLFPKFILAKISKFNTQTQMHYSFEQFSQDLNSVDT